MPIHIKIQGLPRILWLKAGVLISFVLGYAWFSCSSISIKSENFTINPTYFKSLSIPCSVADSGKEFEMARKKKFGKNEPPLPGFSFEKEVDKALKDYKEVGDALQDVICVGPVQHEVENEFELCQEIGVAMKQELRGLGISREEFCDLVNEYLGRTAERYKQTPPLCRKPLTKTMLDKMISDPVQYPLDSYYLYAFHHVTGGFGVVNAILGATGARVVSGEDLRKIALIKAQEFREKAQSLEKSIGRM